MTKFAPSQAGTAVAKTRSRRDFLRGLAAAGASTTFGASPVWAARRVQPRVVVIGGGFAGASCAGFIKDEDHDIDVTLLEPNTTYIACPLSNSVVVGHRALQQQQFGYRGLAARGINVLHHRVTGVDAQKRSVKLDDGRQLSYDRLIVAPGVDLRFDALPGYDETATQAMPHAWQAGAQTLLLQQQLHAMANGGVVVISAPANPYRCPPGPYERASLIAHYLKTQKPRSKLILLDAKDQFSMQKLFEAAWAELYGGLVEWVPLAAGGQVVRVEPATRTLVTEFATYKADVANVIPAQRAAAAAQIAGVVDNTGWCPVDAVTFESTRQAAMHVLGDAIIAGAMPKSAFAANSQARACASAVVDLLLDRTPSAPKLINTCYALVAPDFGISIAGVYQPANGQLTDVAGAGGTSPLAAPQSFRAQEALYAHAWFKTLTSSVFA